MNKNISYDNLVRFKSNILGHINTSNESSPIGEIIVFYGDYST